MSPEAAFTEAETFYPGYVSLKKVDGGFRLTVRAPVSNGGALGEVAQVGQTAQLQLTPSDLRQWLADVNNLYAAYHGGHL